MPVLNVRDSLLLPLRLAYRKVDRGHFDEVLETLGLVGRLRHLPHELSGGQRQRVAIGRAVLARPAVMFADEPTGSLDSETGTEVLWLFRLLVDEMWQTLMLITHDERVASFGDNLIRMKRRADRFVIPPGRSRRGGRCRPCSLAGSRWR